MVVQLEEGEETVLDGGKIGGGMTLALTNKRLLWLQQDKIRYELKLENISEVYPSTLMFSSFTQMKIRTKDGNEYPVNFQAGSIGFLLGGTGYMQASSRTVTDRYVAVINQQLQNTRSVPTEPRDGIFCRYCGGKNETDAVFCKKCVKKIGS